MINTPPTTPTNANNNQPRPINLQALHQQHQTSLRTTSGFTNAPFSKALLGIVVILNFMKAIIGRDKLDFSPKLSVFRSIVQYGFTGHFVFSSNIELLLGCITIYFFRLFERHWGSQKFAKFYLFTTYASFILQYILTSSLTSRKLLISGPYGIMFAALLVYVIDIPPTANLKLFNFIPITDKQTIYVVFIQLILSYFPQTLVPAISGAISGAIYQYVLCRVFKLDRKVAFPKIIITLADQIKQVIQRTPEPATVANATNNNIINNQRGGIGISEQELNDVFNNLNNQQAQQPNATVGGSSDVSDENVQQLMQMGFSRQDCEMALRQAGNDIHLATELLLHE